MKLYPIYRIRVCFKSGGSMTFDARGFSRVKKSHQSEVRWQNLGIFRERVLMCDPDEIVGCTYRIIGFSFKKSDVPT